MKIEIRILDWLQSLRTPAADGFMTFVTHLGDSGMIWILLTAVLLLISAKRKSGMRLAAALLLDLLLCNLILKNAFGRLRPFEVNPGILLLIPAPQDFSFPSGHTAASFAAVSALFFAGEKWLWKGALVLAVLIAVSRMYLYVHFPTDILGGMAVGLFCGYLPEGLQKIRRKAFP